MSGIVYVVTLADRESGAMQRILVSADCTHDMQEFVSGIEDLQIADPVVIDIAETSLKLT